jgi:tetratricopeptide (TPR) repeat protein
MRATGLLLAIVLTAPAAAQDRDGEQDTQIVVTGISLAQTQRQLAECLARHCPPAEDIEATLAHAENQFIAGDYAGARRTLAKGHGRNYKYAKTLPVEVADLDRAYGRLTNLNGFPEIGRFLQIRSLQALKAGLDDDDGRVLVQRVMLGDEFARAGRERAAEDVYRAVAKRARKTGRFDLQGYAMLREALMYGAIASSWSQYRDAAEHRIRALENTREPELAPYRSAAKLLRAQLALLKGDHAALDKAIAAIPPQASGKPMLVYAPPVAVDRTGTTTAKLSDPEWIDVAFRIAADGTVREVETLRDSGNVGRYWPAAVHKAVAARRYTPQATDGAMRIERFSYVHDSVAATGTRIPQRLSRGRISSLDITEDPSRS